VTMSELTYATIILQMTFRAGTALLLATLGEIYAERSGILNLGVEGMMSMGAISGFIVAHLTGNPWLGLLVAALVGGIFSIVHAFASITMHANQIVSGLALTMLGLGLSAIIGRGFIGIELQNTLDTIYIPGLSDLPIIGALFSLDPIAYIALILGVILWYVLYYTRFGLSIRAAGENPSAADTLGINVYAVRYISVIIGGALAGLAGAHLTLSYTPTWIEGMTAGKGWIAIGLTIFAFWSPAKAILGAYLFGGIEVLQFPLQAQGIPTDISGMLPYIFTIIALMFGARERIRKKVGAPAALAIPYIREEKT